MKGVKETLEIILGAIQPMKAEMCCLMEARGRVLAEPVVSQRNLPPRDNSAMDGYAFRHPGGESAETTLKVVEEIAAGHPGKLSVGVGEASKIMTGAPIPAGADTVVPVEEVTRRGDEVILSALPPRGTNVRLAGEDVPAGREILPVGALIRPAEVGMLAALGRSFVKVSQRPRVAILSTGDEIVEIDRAADSGMIVNSNSYALAAQVAEAGGVPMMLGIGRDDPDGLMEMLERAGTAEMVLTTGGVSMGDYDYVPEVLVKWGVKIAVRKVAMKPGKPTIFGLRGNTAVFGLPGNPVSAMVAFEQFVRPAIRKLTGCGNLFRPVVRATLSGDAGKLSHKGDRTEFIRCQVQKGADGFTVQSLKKRESGMLSTIVKANGLMVVPPGEGTLNPGDEVLVQLYDYEFMEGAAPGW